MIRDELTAIWDAERHSPSRDAYEGRRMLGVRAFEAYAGADPSGARRFAAIRLNPEERKVVASRYPRSSNGIAVEAVEGAGGKVSFFLREQAGVPEKVFPAVIEDVLSAGLGLDAPAALRGAFRRFASWQAALSRRSGAMPGAEARGIIGELLVALEILIPSLGGARTVQVWRAAMDDHIHDFVGTGWELEVKSILVPGASIHVSAKGQLEPELGNRMFLVAVPLEADEGGVSLTDLTNRLGAAGGSDVALAAALRDALVGRGALLPSLDGEAARRYRTKGIELYEVKDGFPLIRQASLARGIDSLQYVVGLGACASFKVSPGDVDTVIKSTERTT